MRHRGQCLATRRTDAVDQPALDPRPVGNRTATAPTSLTAARADRTRAHTERLWQPMDPARPCAMRTAFCCLGLGRYGDA